MYFYSFLTLFSRISTGVWHCLEDILGSRDDDDDDDDNEEGGRGGGGAGGGGHSVVAVTAEDL